MTMLLGVAPILSGGPVTNFSDSLSALAPFSSSLFSVSSLLASSHPVLGSRDKKKKIKKIPVDFS